MTQWQRSMMRKCIHPNMVSYMPIKEEDHNGEGAPLLSLTFQKQLLLLKMLSTPGHGDHLACRLRRFTSLLLAAQPSARPRLMQRKKSCIPK